MNLRNTKILSQDNLCTNNRVMCVVKILSSLDFPIKHKSVKTLNFTNFTAKKLWVECVDSAKKGRTFFVRLPHDLEDNSRGALSVIKAKKCWVVKITMFAG